MKFNLTKPLCFFDLEATGLNVIRDRIVQIAIIKIHPGDKPNEEFEELINPGIPISEEALEVHGITPKMLKNKPVFQQVAQKIFDFIGDSDLAGYNSNRFDVPMLMEEFARVGIELKMEGRRTIDVQRIFYKMEPRTLRAALKFYRGKEMINAHDALADVQATIEVMEGQLEKYKGVHLVNEMGNVDQEPVRNDMEQLHKFSNDSNMIDATKRLKYNHNGVVVFNFGKYAGQPAAEVLVKDKQYYQWILNKEFSTQVKTLVKQLVKDYERDQKLSLPLCIIAFLFVGCYENEEGCQDIFAQNFDGSADIPCEDCCTYPELTLSIQHVLDTFPYSTARKVYNGLGDTFLIIQAGLLLQNVSLTQDAGSIASTTQRNFQLLDGSTLTDTDDFVLARTTTSNYTLGEHMSEGAVNAVSVDFGLTAEQEQIDPAALPETHALSTASGFTYEGSYIAGYADVLYDTITMDTVRYRLPAQLGLSFLTDTAFSISYGSDATLRIKIDYQKWMEGINFEVNGQDEAAVIQAIVNNLPNSISLADE